MNIRLHRIKLTAFSVGAIFLLGLSLGPVSAQKVVGGTVIQMHVTNTDGGMSISRIQLADTVQRSGNFPIKAGLGKVFVVVPFKLTRAKGIGEAFLEDSGKQRIAKSEHSIGSELVFEVPRAYAPSKLIVKSATGAEWVFADIKKLIAH